MAGHRADPRPPHRRQVGDRARHPGGRFPQQDGRFLVVASNGGSPTHPAWYHNLKANPSVDIEVGAETFTVVAEDLDETARTERWPQLAAQAPQIDDHQAKVTRRIPVLMLTRQN